MPWKPQLNEKIINNYKMLLHRNLCNSVWWVNWPSPSVRLSTFCWRI